MPRFEALRRPRFFRPLIGWAFLLWCAGMGARFGLWMGDPSFPRPAGVEGFLPVGALVSLRHLLASGVFDPTHPAGLTLLLTFLAMSLLARRSFCSFVCPVGTVSEALWKGGKRLFGRSLGAPWRMPKRLDLPLRSLKYLLLAFFVWLVFISMTPEQVAVTVDSPYEKVADIMMWRFFTRIGPLALGVFAALGALSLLIQNFWCRTLCPYGALVGLAGMLSPWKIRRDDAACTGCGACSKACPSWLPVMEKRVVRSAECTGCLTCVDHCPAPGALRMALPGGKDGTGRERRWWVYPACVLLLFALGVGAGMATGHWTSSLTPGEVRRALAEAPAAMGR
jgi:polyferredoxin